MTPAEVRALTDDELRMEIAKALGWRQHGADSFGYLGWHDWQNNRYFQYLPDWPRDLNACAELRREIERRGLCGDYLAALDQTIDWKGPQMIGWCRANATARQSSEAALLALQRKET